MTQIDFYHHVADPAGFACRLAATVIRHGERLTVLLADEAALAGFDTRLWSFPPQGFVPHVRLDDPLAAETPVLLTTALPATPVTGVLLNLSLGEPANFTAYPRILEIVGEDDAQLARARDVARAYKRAGLDTTYHDMAGR
ncbi:MULTISPECIES: DNA polymerase III subunit chi [Microvirgula]|uniref:DNA polymerase III subunit chi n=1 Tax=Microvirgula aerodenitrificans TaxID=57480 RepID=A0A2S0PCF7_9NEIS|nr:MULTISPECIES: DNA polymerase III subunit chi [Microvirgula]AVY95070.1 DNA polymerase III subunit chi [Microvirgula aerodenitrificans]RAS15966.1 DNA polymerase III chi subunit [Microvirgula sp. AG722]